MKHLPFATPEDAAAGLPEASSPDPELQDLSARQRQILELLRAGKVNKEIANELGIGLGTVKQHVVALFKKLNVRNRTMAVSRATAHHKSAITEANAGLLERRPCVVLSFFLTTAEAAQQHGRLLHQVLAAQAYDHDAIYLARRDVGGDLIFGIQRCSETLVPQALLASDAIAASLRQAGVAPEASVSCGLTAGIAVASMRRQGGWSGEAIASATIAEARILAGNARAGQLALGAAALDLLTALGPVEQCRLSSTVPLAEAGSLPWRIDPSALQPPSLCGRDHETEQLQHVLRKAADGEGQTVFIEGENGTGKSSLCRLAAAQVLAAGGKVRYWVCLAYAGRCLLHDLATGEDVTPAMLKVAIQADLSPGPQIWIIDDSHLLPADELANLVAAQLPERQLRLFAGRRHPPALYENAALRLRLTRLPQHDMVRIARMHLDDERQDQAEAIAQQAAGIPLFAIQLARAQGCLPLVLRFVVGSRMDRLDLDRFMLRHMAHEPGKWALSQLARCMGESRPAVAAAIERAAAAGVLQQDEQQCWRFSHPLIRRIILEAEVD